MIDDIDDKFLIGSRSVATFRLGIARLKMAAG